MQGQSSTSETSECVLQRLQHNENMIPYLRLNMARLSESLECDPPPAEDVEAMAQFLGIHNYDSQLVREVRVHTCFMHGLQK
jgi:hypothetical protein